MRSFALATDTPYSQITQAAAASQRASDHRSYVQRYQNSSVWESQEPSSVCQCHDIIMSLSDEVPFFAVLYSICCQPATRTRNNKFCLCCYGDCLQRKLNI